MATNVVEIAIQAKDQASQQIQAIASSFKGVEIATNAARGSLQLFSAAAIASGTGVIRTFGGLKDAIQSVRDVLDTDTGKVFLEQISTLADDALSNLAPLSKVLKEIKEGAKSLGSGLTSSQTSAQANNAIFSDNGKRIDDILKSSANKFSKALEDSVKASRLNKAIEDELGIGAKELGGILDEVIADSFVEGLIGAAIPNVLKGAVNQVFGADLTAILSNSFRESAKTGFLTEISKQLAQGSFTGAAKTFAIGAVGPTLENFQNNAGRLSGSLGESVGRTLSGEKTVANNEFKILDEQLGGSFAELINRVANRIPAIVEKLPLPPIARLIANRLAQTSIDTGKNEFQGLANSLSSGLFNAISEKIPEDLKLLGTVLRPAFEIQKKNLSDLAKKTLGIDFEGTSADLSRSVKRFASKAVDTIDSALGAAIGAGGGKGGTSPLAGLASKVDDFFGNAFSDVLKATGSSAGKSFIEGLKSSVYAEISSVVDRVDQILVSSSRKVQSIAPQLQKIPDVVGDAIGVVSGATEPVELFNIISEGAGKATSAIFEISQRLAFLGLGFQALQGLVNNGPFDTLIGQNARLQEQLISTQASLAATNKVLIDGQRVTDPTKAITGLGSEVNGAIDNIRKASLELVGVTSKDLVGVFQIVAGQASNIGASLNDAANITTSVAAALGTLGLPLYQARQEVVSIATGTIDMNSALAKNLNLNNEMVNKWKAQGTFVQELLTRLEAFKAGNKLAAQTIGGITSNIQELVDEIGRLAGERFLAPLVKELDGFYQYFAKNKDTIAKQVSDLAGIFFTAFTSVLTAVKSLSEPFFQIFGQVPEYLLRSLVGAVQSFAAAIAFTVSVLKPAINVFEQVATVVGPLGGIWIGITVGAKVLAGAIGFLNKGFALMFNLVPGLGEALFLLDKRSNGIVNTFTNLSGVLGKGSAGFLLLGANLNKIPGAAAFANKELAKLLGGFSPLSGVITSILPSVSGFGVKLIGLTQAFPALGTALGGFAKAAPAALLGLSGIVGKSQLFGAFSPLIAEAAKGLGKFANVATDTAKVNDIFSKALTSSGVAIKEFVGQTALLGAGTFAAFVFFDQLILKNKGLQKILKAITDAIRSFADAIASFFGPLISAVSGFLSNLVGLGENSTIFDKITGGILLALVAIKFFGSTITSVFSNINKSVASTFDGISGSISKIAQLSNTIKQVVFGGKEINSKFLETGEGRSASSSNLIDRGKTLRGALSDPTLSPEYRDAIKRQQDQLALDAQALKKGDANKISTSTRREILNSVKADAEASISVYEKQDEKLRNNRKKAEQLASADRKVVLEETKKFKKELGRLEVVQLTGNLTGTSTPGINAVIDAQKEKLGKQIEESKKAADKINAVEAEKLKTIQTLREENARKLAQYRNTLNTVNSDIANLTEASAKRVITSESKATEKRRALQAELKKIDSDLKLDKSLDIEKRQALLKQGLDAAKAKKVATSPEDIVEQQSRIDSARKALALQNPNQILGANARKQEIQSELAGLKTYGEAFSELIDPTKKQRLAALADLETYKQKRKKLVAELATIDAETGRSASGRTKLGLQNEIKGLDANIVEVEQRVEKLQSPVRKAAKGIVSSFKNLFAELGPALLIGAAFTAITTIVGYVSERAKSLTESSDAIAEKLKEGRKALDILATSQSENAAKALKQLTEQRDSYVRSIKDPSILQDDPTLKLYDQQLAKLKELKGLQSKPTGSDAEIRAEIDKRRAANPFQAGVVDFLGAINPLAPNYKEGEVQDLKAGESLGLANAQSAFQDLRTKGLTTQKGLELELKRLEGEKSKAEQLGDKDGVALIDTKIEAQKLSLSIGKKQIDNLLDQVRANRSNSQSQKDLIENLQKLQAEFKNLNTTIAPLDLPRIGNAIEQATARYKAAVRALDESAGDPALFKTKLGELLEVSKELQEAGILTADEVSNNFARIATSVTADRDLQIKAQQSITEAYQKEAQRRVGIYDSQIAKIQALLATGKISESESIALTGKLEEKKLLEQLDAVEQSSKAKKVILEKNAQEEKENIQRDRKLAEAQKAAATGDPTKVQKIREDLSPTLDKKRDEIQGQITQGNAELKKLQDQLTNGEISGSDAAKKIDDVKAALVGLNKQLSLIADQKGKLDSVLKLSSASKGDLDKLKAEIESADKELATARIRRDGAQAAITSGKTFGDQKGFEKTRDAQAQKVAELEEAQKARREKQSQIEGMLKKNPEAAKLADGEIAAQDKKESDRQSTLEKQRARLAEDAEKDRAEKQAAVLKLRAENALKTLDSRIKETLQAEKVGETQRLAQIAQLRKSGVKLESEIKLQETAERKRSIALELQLEQQKQKQIEDLKKKGIGVSDETRNANRIKVAELTKQLAEAELAAIEGLVSVVDSRIKETLQAEKVGETQRLAQIAQLRKSGVRLTSEIALLEAAERKRSLTLELGLEQQKQKEIARLEKAGIGINREIKVANLLKLAEIAKQIAEEEAANIDKIISAVRDRLTLESQKYAVTIEQQNLKLERQKLLFTALERGLENQNRLSESANKLTQSTIALRESEFNALNKIYDRQQAAIRKAGGEGNFADLELEEKKLIIAEKLAVIKLNALKQQQKFEAESLERDIQKRDLALERKKVENDIAIAKKKIDIASQDAAIKSAELEVKLRPQSEEAKLKLAQARLGQEKNFLELGGLQQEKGFIAQEATVNDLVSNNDRRSLFNQQQSQTNSAIGDVIGATRDDALRERLQQEQLQRLVGTTGRAALTTTDVSNAVAAAGQPINVRGASFKSPNSELLGRVEQGGTFTAAPAAPRDDSFATSFEELARKYPNNGVGSIEELNKKFPSQASSFEELNAKYSGKPEPEQAIVSSFDRLTTQIDEGFAKVLVAPDVKVKDLTLSLEAEFERVSKKISENPAKLTIDDSEIKKLNELVAKPLTVFDDKQLERVESVIVALGKGVAAAGFESFAKGASPSNITINAPTTINEAQQKAGSSREEFKEVFNDILKRTIQVTSGTR